MAAYEVLLELLKDRQKFKDGSSLPSLGARLKLYAEAIADLQKAGILDMLGNEQPYKPNPPSGGEGI